MYTTSHLDHNLKLVEYYNDKNTSPNIATLTFKLIQDPLARDSNTLDEMYVCQMAVDEIH